MVSNVDPGRTGLSLSHSRSPLVLKLSWRRRRRVVGSLGFRRFPHNPPCYHGGYSLFMWLRSGQQDRGGHCAPLPALHIPQPLSQSWAVGAEKCRAGFKPQAWQIQALAACAKFSHVPFASQKDGSSNTPYPVAFCFCVLWQNTSSK